MGDIDVYMHLYAKRAELGEMSRRQFWVCIQMWNVKQRNTKIDAAGLPGIYNFCTTIYKDEAVLVIIKKLLHCDNFL